MKGSTQVIGFELLTAETLLMVRDLIPPEDLKVNRLLKPVIVLLATVYFVVDAVLMVVARPVADWLSERRIFCGLKAWIVSLSPYPTLALFALPVILLEPAKPCAAYLVATDHFIIGLTVFAVGETLKLVIIERLFAVSCQKLLSIPVFAWGYGHYYRILNALKATSVWQAVRRWSKVAQYSIRSFALHLKASQKPARISFQR
jgi:hypothetical protein